MISYNTTPITCDVECVRRSVVHEIRSPAIVVVDPMNLEPLIGRIVPDSCLCIARETGGFSGLWSVVRICR
jgi:hypothetical protein